MKKIYIKCAVFLIVIFLIAQGGAAFSAQESSNVQQQSVLSNSGTIEGVVKLCGSTGYDGTEIDIVGRSFHAETDDTGRFYFNYVPAGDHRLRIRIPRHGSITITVYVDKNATTDLGLLAPCPDDKGELNLTDYSSAAPSCDPSAKESCDGIDNNCDGVIDEGCPTCISNNDCTIDEFCEKTVGNCNGVGTCSPKPENCTFIYNPVCGCDGNTYPNECDAHSEGINIFYRGTC